MDRIRIRGGARLTGEIPISGAKNAALKLMAACLLTDETLRLGNVPALVDVAFMADLLRSFGVEVGHRKGTRLGEGGQLTLSAASLSSTTAEYDIVRKMRASFQVLGPLLARHGQAKVSLPGGCAIGARPVDIHIKGFEALGAEIELADGYVLARAPKGLVGASYTLPFASVGATENLDDRRGAGPRPHGAEKRGPRAGDPGSGPLPDRHGREDLRPRHHRDRHRRRRDSAWHRLHASWPTASRPAPMPSPRPSPAARSSWSAPAPTPIAALIGAARIASAPRSRATARGLFGASQWRALRPPSMSPPMSIPAFPTDLQAQFMALMAMSQGTSHITETVFENRFMHVPELLRMGADIRVDGELARGARRGPAQGRAGHGHRSARQLLAWCWRGWRRRAKPSSIASIIWIAASSGWRKSSRARRRRYRTVEGMSAHDITLAAEDGEDLQIISARLQDAVAKIGDLVYLPQGAPLRGAVQSLPLGGEGRHARAVRACISTT